jgi:hypothetical protein
MRTRIALVAISPIAVITVSTLVQVASEQSTGAVSAPSAETSPSTIDSIPPNALIAYRGLETSTSAPGGATVLLDLGGALLLHPPASAVPVAVAPATTAVTVDTVTPEQRAAWERVAMCEEGGDWNVNGGEFSGGLGISRANWDAYGGTQFAGEGADATEDQQIMVAERIQSYPPDQDGCRGW